MSHGEEIRRARRAHGWTQAELARRVGLTQGRISQIETGGLVPTAHVAPLREVLGLTTPTPRQIVAEPTAPKFSLAPLGQLLPIPLSIEACRRPQHLSGDLHAVRVIGSSVLIVAADIAGHGLQAFPGAAYAQGLIHGVTTNLAVVPELQSLAESVLQACARVGVTGAFAFALFRLTAAHRVIVDIVSFGYPEPIIVDGPQLSSPLPTNRIELRTSIGGDGVLARFELSGGWRLLLASDGVLDRIGVGNELEGRRALLAWLKGPRRDEPLERLMTEDDDPGGDDESLLLASWRSWDDEVATTVTDDKTIVDFVRRSCARVAAASNDNVADRFSNALVEATANACKHAAAGERLWLRFRDEPFQFVAEIEDRGHGIGKGADKPNAGIAYQKASARIDFRRATPSGTICTLSIEKESK